MSAPTRPWELRLLQRGGLELRAHISAVLPFVLWDHGRVSVAGALGMLVVVLTHGVGHLLAATAAGGRVRALTFSGLGAWPRRAGDWPRRAALACALGGVLAQAALLMVAVIARPWVLHLSDSGAIAAFHEALVFGNLALLLVNLIPLGMSDGAMALRLAGPARPRAAARPPATPLSADGPPPPIPDAVARQADALMRDLTAEAKARRADARRTDEA